MLNGNNNTACGYSEKATGRKSIGAMTGRLTSDCQSEVI